MQNSWFIEEFLTTKLIATLMLAVLLLAARYMTARYIRRANYNWTSQQRLRWIGTSRTFFFVILLLSVIYLWGETIQGFAVSVFAIAFAMVFSVKELCMCFNGSIVRLRGHLYEIGDRIEVKGIRGDVIRTTLLTTTVVEVGNVAANHQFTGRSITFSNSLLLTHPVTNESFLENYYMINLKIPLSLESDWKKGKQLLLEIAQEECAPYLEQARIRIRRLERSRSLELPSVEPRISVQISEHDKIDLHLRTPSPVHLKERLEQVIINRFLENFYLKSPRSSKLHEALTSQESHSTV